ncbi:hypothetical protein Aperf_G00000066241 [Anoplocephala perfoliata]
MTSQEALKNEEVDRLLAVLSSNHNSPLKVFPFTDYDVGFTFDVKIKTIYIMAQIPETYPKSPPSWVTFDSCGRNTDSTLEVHDNKLTQELFGLVYAISTLYFVKFPPELASLDTEYYKEMEIKNGKDEGLSKTQLQDYLLSDFKRIYLHRFQSWYKLNGANHRELSKLTGQISQVKEEDHCCELFKRSFNQQLSNLESIIMKAEEKLDRNSEQYWDGKGIYIKELPRKLARLMRLGNRPCLAQFESFNANQGVYVAVILAGGKRLEFIS